MDVAALATRLRALAADLPGPGLETAGEHLDAARAELTEATRESRAEIGLSRLGAAREHLATARTRLGEATAAVDDYLAAIGAAGPASAPAATASSAPAGTAPVDPRRWWTDQVNELCRRSGAAGRDSAPPTRLFNELLRTAAEGDPAAYHRRLRDAGPETGVKLAGLAWPLVRTLAAEHLGRTPTTRDLPRLRERTTDKVRALVPGAEPDHITAALASACTLKAPDKSDDQRRAVTTAAVGPALVAALHNLSKTERKGTRA